MSLKEQLKMKLPFTRKGLENYLDEMQRQQANDIQSTIAEQIGALAVRLAEEMNAQLHRRTNDLDRAAAFQTEVLTARFAEEMNLQLHRRINDLERAMESQTGAQTEDLFVRLKEEINLQFHRRINDLEQSVTSQTGAQTAELSALLCSGQTDNSRAGLKAGRQIFLFDAAPSDGIANELAKTFHAMGYGVHYLYADKAIENSHDLLPPMMECVSVNIYSLDKLADTLRTGALFVFAASDPEFLPYLSFARKYMFCTVCLQDEAALPLLEAAPEEWYSYCDKLLQRVELLPPAAPLISIIVLNHNNRAVIFRCVDSLLAFKPRYNYEIIVVDNASTDGSPEELEARYGDRINLLRNKKNGCSSGRNIGVEAARGEFIYFFDSDQWVISPRHLDNALYIMNREYQVGAVGWGAGWFSRQNGVLGSIADNYPNRGISSPQVLYRTDIAYLGTDGMLMRKSLFNEIGGFDEAYDPTCFEDTDLSLKIKHAGYKLAYCPYMGVCHQPHQTTNSGSNAHSELLKRNAVYFTQKWKTLDPVLLEVYN